MYIRIMSNIGKQPIIIPDSTEIDIKGNTIIIKGKLGELNLDFNPSIKISKDENSGLYPPSEPPQERRSLDPFWPPSSET